MDLDKLKNNWNQHNELLQKNLQVNEKLLTEMKLDKAKGAIQKPYIAELSALIFLSTASFLWAQQIPSLAYNQIYFVMGILVFLGLVGGALTAWTKIKAMKKIDFINCDILSIQENLIHFKKTVKKMVYFEIGLVASLLASFPVIFKVLKGKDLFDLNNPIPVYVYLGIVILLVAPIAIWLIPKLYYQKINDANERLKEIQNFKEEN